jgi:hypothetical protein
MACPGSLGKLPTASSLRSFYLVKLRRRSSCLTDFPQVFRQVLPSYLNLRPIQLVIIVVNATTLIELIGMMIAATTGASWPVTAK